MTETKVEVRTEVVPVVLRVYPALEMDEERFFEFCQQNRDLRIERTERGDLEIMPPTGGETGNRNAEVTMQLGVWARRDDAGVAFDSSTGFVLPNGAMRSPDAAWVKRERLSGLTAGQKQKFLPLCPDFAIELRSPSDRLSVLQAELGEYLENGARLGWLVDVLDRRVYVYRPGREVERLDGTNEVSGGPELPGFALDLRRIWEPGF